MKAKDLLKILKEDPEAGILIEKESDEILRMSGGKMAAASYDYFPVLGISKVNKSIVIRVGKESL